MKQDNLIKYYLKDIAVSQTGPFGSQLHKEDYVKFGTPIVTVEHLEELEFSHNNLPKVCDEDKKRLKKYVLEEGDIVFSRVGSVDRSTYVSKNESGWLFSGRCLRVRSNEKVNSRYLSFYFRQKNFKKMMLNISVGAIMASLNTSLMNNIEINLPPITSQNEIVKILLAIDDKLRINNKINKELEEMAKDLYNYWFIQFDFPDENGKPYKSSGGEMVYNEKLKREIPKGWEVLMLNEYLNFEKGVEPGTKNYFQSNENNELIPFYKVGDMDNQNSLWITSDIAGNSISKEGDILVSFDGTVGRLVVGLDGAFSSGIRKIYQKKGYFPESYIYFLFQSQEIQKTIKKYAIGSNILHASSSIDVLSCPYYEDIVKSFEKRTNFIFKKIVNNIKENKELTQLRDFLLPLLMNGQVKVLEQTQEIANRISIK